MFRNVVSIVKPPKVEEKEIQILTAGQIADIIEKLRDHPIYPIVVVALGTGLRRGELLALQWSNVDLVASSLQVERSVEETKGGLRFKAPKSKNSRRSVSLPPPWSRRYAIIGAANSKCGFPSGSGSSRTKLLCSPMRTV